MTGRSILKRDPYSKYRIRLAFRDRVFGGYPKNRELIRSWIKSRTGHDDEQTDKQVAEAEAALEGQLLEESTWTGFPRDEVGVYLDSRAVKAMLRECFSVARIFVQKPGTKQIFQHALVVDGLQNQDRIYLEREDGTHLGEPDGNIERPIHPDTAQGKRSALKRADYAERVEVEFLLRVLKTHPQEGRHIGRDELELALVIGQEDGLGADRSQGFGRFDVIKFDRLDSDEDAPEPKETKKRGKK